MKVTRRTMLKSGAGFALTASLPVGVRLQEAGAQTPQYELIDLVSFTESIDISGTPFFGGLAGLTSDGRAYGSQVEGELLVPKFWLASGGATPIPLGEHSGVSAQVKVFAADGVALVNQFPNGLSGTGIEVLLLDSTGANITLAAPDESGGVLQPLAINDTGGVAGTYFSNASSTGTWAIRWIAGTPALLENPDGFTSARALAINVNGDVAGDVLDANLRSKPLVWMADGTFQLLELPAEYESLDSSVLYINVFAMSQEGDPLVRFVNSAESTFQSGWYSAGTWQPLPAITAGQNVNASSGNPARITLGAVISGSDRIATIWQDGEVLELNGLVAPGSGLALTSASAINESGEIAAMADDADGVHHGVLLRPIA